MRNAWLIIRREYIERIRSKAFIIMTVLMPLFMASTILLPAWLAEMKSNTTRHLVFVTDDPEVGNAVEQELLASAAAATASLPKKEASKPVPEYSIRIDQNVSDSERDKLRKQISDGSIDGFLWLTNGALANRRISYNARDVADFGQTVELRNAVTSAFVKRQLAAKGMTGERVEELLKPIEIDAIHVEKGKEGASGISVFLTSFVMIMLLYANVLVYGFAVMRSIIEEKSTRILEVLLSSVTAKELLAGKIIGVGAVGLTQIFIWLIMAGLFSVPGLLVARSYLSDIRIPVIGIVAFAVFFLLGYFLYATMYAAMGAMVNSDQEAQQVQWPAMLPIVFSIVLSTPVLQHPNSQMAIWLSMVPFFAPILMFVRVLIEQPPAWQLAVCIALMIATTYGLLVLSSRIYRVGILMYGKRPSLPELKRWLRYAG